jgi:hypothetical protein
MKSNSTSLACGEHTSQNVADCLLAACDFVCNGCLRQALCSKCEYPFIPDFSSGLLFQAALPSWEGTSLRTHRFTLTSSAVTHVFVPVRVLLCVFMTVLAHREIQLLSEGASLLSCVLPVRQARVPSDIFQVVVSRVRIWVMAALLAGWAWPDERFQYQCVNELVRLDSILGQNYLEVAFLVRLWLQDQLRVPVLVLIYARQAPDSAPVRDGVETFVVKSWKPAFGGVWRYLSHAHNIITCW